MTSILMVEDHPYMAKVIKRYLQEVGELEVAAVASTGQEELELLLQIEVDLALVDVSLPNMSGIDLVAELHRKYPQLPCLMLSGHTARQLVQRSLAVGAKGYIIKDNPSAIIEGIRCVLAGGTYLSIETKDE
jgi:DNA-binding NarL/FixJ family response regulator